MRHPINYRRLALLMILTLTFLINVKGQGLPSRKEIFARMQLANRYFMQKWPDPGSPVTVTKEGKSVTRSSELWTRAVYYEGLMAFNEVDPKKEYVDYAVDWSTKHNWSPRGSVDTRNADNQCCGQTYIDLYNLDKKPERIEKVKQCMDLVAASQKNDDWTWIDAIQMAMPVFAKLGVIYKDEPKYFEKMYAMYSHARNIEGGGLYNTKEHLWWRDKAFVPPYREPNGANCYWSRGNGWAYAALVRVLKTIPKHAPHYEEYLATFLDMSKALAPLQRTDGYWNVSLKDPSNFGGKELTGTSLFVYGMSWGISSGLLDRKEYLPVVTKAWNAMIKNSLHPNGFLGFVQGSGKEPKDSQPVTYTSVPDFEDYGLGCFLLAGTELSKLTDQKSLSDQRTGKTIYPNEIWPDNNGNHIQAHGGGIIKWKENYYWYGEARRIGLDSNRRYVSCYRSKDLVNWTFLSDALNITKPDSILGQWVVERPKVYYNAKTKKFVMYMHVDGSVKGLSAKPNVMSYTYARVGVAVSDKPEGPFKFRETFRPLGHESRDIGQFIDDDGAAYLIFEDRPSKGFRIAKLSDDYLKVEEEMSLITERIEGGAIVHYKGLYYVLGSGLTGWKPNPNKYATAISLRGPWSEFKDVAPPERNTYGSQSTMMIKVAGTKTTSVIYMGDVWKPNSQWDSRYQWMPLQIGDGKLWLEEPKPWTLDVKTGEAKIVRY